MFCDMFWSLIPRSLPKKKEKNIKGKKSDWVVVNSQAKGPMAADLCTDPQNYISRDSVSRSLNI